MNQYQTLDLLFLRRMGYNLIDPTTVETALKQRMGLEDAIRIYRNYSRQSYDIKKPGFDKEIWIKLAGSKYPATYENMVEFLKNPSHRKRSGIHLTPYKLADFSVKRIFPHLRYQIIKQNSILCDPSCGSGVFLRSLLSNILFSNGSKGSDIILDKLRNGTIRGYDKDMLGLHASDLAVREVLLTVGGVNPVKLAPIKLPLYQTDWLLSEEIGDKFDLIIGNPPWVRIQHLNENYRTSLSNKFKLLEGRFDLSLAFIECSLNRLNRGGILSFVLSNKILMANYARKLRPFLATKNTILEIHDFADSKIFGASVLPMILSVQKQKPDFNSKFVYSTWNDGIYTNDSNLNNDLVFNTIGYSALNRDLWSFGDNGENEIIQNIEQACPTSLGKYAHEIRVGIKTTANDVFANPITTNFLNQYEGMARISHPVIRGTNIKKWNIQWSGNREKRDTHIIYPHKQVNSKTRAMEWNELPESVKQWFQKNEDALKQRKYVQEAGRKWYEIWVPQSPSLFNGLKIVVPDISTHNCFALDEKNYYCLDSAYTIKLNDMASKDEYLYLLGWLNSQPIEKYFKQRLKNSLYSKKLRYMKNNLEKIPVFPFRSLEADYRNSIVEIVRRINTNTSNGKDYYNLQKELDKCIMEIIMSK